MTLQIGFPIFPDVTQLDFTGPFEVLARLPGAHCHVIAETREPVPAQGGALRFLPTAGFADCPALDIVCVPGGFGHIRAMESAAFLGFLREQARTCRYITSVCTGAMLLAAAGLLKGYRATTHWQSMHRLAQFGAIPTEGRVVVDRNRVTGGGVTAGIDFGLALAAELAGETVARQIAVQIEYRPDPPFSGDPSTASPEILAALKARIAPIEPIQAAADARAAARIRQEGC
jgi:cyclohexyl-isocyanide hydratase